MSSVSDYDLSLSGQRTPRGHLGQEVLEEVFVSTMDHINADHPPGGTPMASPPTQRSKDRRLSADHVINHSRRSSGGSMATIRQEDVSATKEGYEKPQQPESQNHHHHHHQQQQQPVIPFHEDPEPIAQNSRWAVTVRCLQIVCTTAVFFAFSTSLSFKFSEPITQKLLIYVIMTTVLYVGVQIPCLLVQTIRSRPEYVFIVLLGDSTMAFLWVLSLILYKPKGRKAEGVLFGTINVILLLATLIMEIRFLLNGPAPGLKRGRTESAKENHHSNPIMHGSGRHGASPSVRAVVNANVMTGLRSDVTGGKSEFSTARSH